VALTPTPGQAGGQPTRCLRRGQALVEIAVATPLIFLLLLGTLDVSVLVSDKLVAANAVRQGVRLAAILGGAQSNPPPITTAQIDKLIVRDVLAVAGGLNYATLLEVDIYRPSRIDGAYDPAAGDPINQYDSTGAAFGSQTFDLSLRNQIPPTETSVGVRLVWRYTPPTAFGSFTMQLAPYAVMKCTVLI
jgi:Flp pilus assembly protein TadG